MNLTNSLEAAKHYIGLGLVLTPIPYRTKAPKLPGWNTPEVWVDSQEKAERAFAMPANMGMILEPSKLCVLDVDNLDQTKLIFSEYGLNYDQLLKDAPRIRGAKQGRDKAIFRAPAGVALELHALAWETGTVFELRAGPNMDVLPPSMHPDGHPYEWVKSPFDGIPELPQELLNFWNHFKTLEPELKALDPKAKPRPKPKPAKREGDHENIIGLFNQKHDIREILIENGYRPIGKRFLAPTSKTGLPGVVIFDDTHCFSSHASDRLWGKHSHDSFDVFRLWKHDGDWTAAVRDAAAILGIEPELQKTREENRAAFGKKVPEADSATSGAEEWPEPQPIRAELLPVVEFDPETLMPEVLRDWVMDEADRMPCPPDFVAVAAIVGLGAIIGAQCGIKPKEKDDWLIVPNLWGGVVGVPTEKKSPAISAGLSPFPA